MLKHYKVCSPLAILFPVFIETYHYRRSTYAVPPIRSLAHWNVYIGITGTPILPSLPLSTPLFTDQDLRNDLFDLTARTPPSPAPPKNRTSFTSLELICIPHGQLEGKDVADMPYSDETWTAESVGLAMERMYAHRGT